MGPFSVNHCGLHPVQILWRVILLRRLSRSFMSKTCLGRGGRGKEERCPIQKTNTQKFLLLAWKEACPATQALDTKLLTKHFFKFNGRRYAITAPTSHFFHVSRR